MWSDVPLKKRQVYERSLKKIGVEIATSFESDPTHFVVPKFKRTLPLLIAVNQGLSIVTTDWVEASIEKNNILPGKDFSVSSNPTTNISAVAAKGEKPLAGKSVWIMSSVRPLAREWKEVVTAAGGTLLTKYPKKLDKNVIIVGV